MFNWLKKEKNILRIFTFGTAFLIAGCMLAAPQPAQARLDELIRPDAPYFAGPESPAGEKNVRVAATPGIYIVREGDTLGAIALRHNVDVKQLAEMNNLRDLDHIIKGQVLMLPGTTFPYVVQKGETLGSIAGRFGVDEEELAAMNGLRDPDHLLAGQSLMIPAGQGGGSAGVSRALPLNQLRWPVVGWISSPFGMRDGEMHHGLDIAADHGQVVRAVKGGRVVFCGPRGDYGNTVIIDHGSGLQTLYAHNSTLLVREGQKVLAGQPIARVGSTGRSTGPHLHLEVRLNGVPFDPMLCLKRTYA
jgi:LysM repeat protein